MIFLIIEILFIYVMILTELNFKTQTGIKIYNIMTNLVVYNPGFFPFY